MTLQDTRHGLAVQLEALGQDVDRVSVLVPSDQLGFFLLA
ncbi:MAG: hypothetical protein QOF60_3092 [Actinomycetota bacterium]|nr:hypothetical protein [Actinomycetota bacterium]